MNSAAKAISLQGLKRRALSLGAVKAFDQVLQFLLPIVLVRCLDVATFGEYRLLWLVVGTIMTFATLNMCGTLYFFVPRSEPRKKRLYVHQTMLYLAAAGLACGLAVGPWNPLLPAAMQPLQAYGALVPAFVALWVAAILLDFLPTIDERIALQGYATLTIAGLRTLLVGAGAWASGELVVVLWLLVAVVSVKLAVLVAYVARLHGLGAPWFERRAFAEQFSHSAPFGVSNALFALRSQADQWVAASLFALSSFAAFSIAAIVHHVVHIFRHSVMEAFMPTMSRMQAAGDVRGMLELNRRANVMVGTALFPLLAAAFVFADEIVTIVYTASFIQAAPAMRLYIVGMLAMVIEIGSIVLLLRQGPFALKMTAATLAVSVAVSWSGAQLVGLTGAAAGSVLAIYLDRALMLTRVSRLTGIGLRRVQDWRALGWALASAVIAAGLAWITVEELLASQGAFVRLVAGTAVLAAAYAAMNLRKFLR
jgi:O-antigen/teichoic acid export membrane protein